MMAQTRKLAMLCSAVMTFGAVVGFLLFIVLEERWDHDTAIPNVSTSLRRRLSFSMAAVPIAVSDGHSLTAYASSKNSRLHSLATVPSFRGQHGKIQKQVGVGTSPRSHFLSEIPSSSVQHPVAWNRQDHIGPRTPLPIFREQMNHEHTQKTTGLDDKLTIRGGSVLEHEDKGIVETAHVRMEAKRKPASLYFRSFGIAGLAAAILAVIGFIKQNRAVLSKPERLSSNVESGVQIEQVEAPIVPHVTDPCIESAGHHCMSLRDDTGSRPHAGDSQIVPLSIGAADPLSPLMDAVSSSRRQPEILDQSFAGSFRHGTSFADCTTSGALATAIFLTTVSEVSRAMATPTLAWGSHNLFRRPSNVLRANAAGRCARIVMSDHLCAARDSESSVHDGDSIGGHAEATVSSAVKSELHNLSILRKMRWRWNDAKSKRCKRKVRASKNKWRWPRRLLPGDVDTEISDATVLERPRLKRLSMSLKNFKAKSLNIRRSVIIPFVSALLAVFMVRSVRTSALVIGGDVVAPNFIMNVVRKMKWQWVKSCRDFRVRPMTFISIPIVSGIVGYITNWVGVKMLFKPVQWRGIPIKQYPEEPFGWIGWQGVVPCKRYVMAKKMVDVTISKLVDVGDVFKRMDPKELARILEPEVHSLVLGGLSPEIVNLYFLEQVCEEVINRAPEIVDIENLVVKDLATDGTTLADFFNRVGSSELRFLVNSGVGVGFVLGLFQMLQWMVSPMRWTLPAGGAVVGYITNWVALKLIFEPLYPRRVGPVELQGMFLKRQPQVAEEFSEYIAGKTLCSKRVWADVLSGESVSLFTDIVASKLPLPRRDVEKIVSHLQDIIGSEKPHPLHVYTDQALRLRQTLEIKMKAMTSPEFEQVLHPVFQEDELTLIMAGAVLGAAAGGMQLA